MLSSATNINLPTTIRKKISYVTMIMLKQKERGIRRDKIADFISNVRGVSCVIRFKTML